MFYALDRKVSEFQHFPMSLTKTLITRRNHNYQAAFSDNNSCSVQGLVYLPKFDIEWITVRYDNIVLPFKVNTVNANSCLAASPVSFDHIAGHRLDNLLLSVHNHIDYEAQSRFSGQIIDRGPDGIVSFAEYVMMRNIDPCPMHLAIGYFAANAGNKNFAAPGKTTDFYGHYCPDPYYQVCFRNLFIDPNRHSLFRISNQVQ